MEVIAPKRLGLPLAMILVLLLLAACGSGEVIAPVEEPESVTGDVAVPESGPTEEPTQTLGAEELTEEAASIRIDECERKEAEAEGPEDVEPTPAPILPGEPIDIGFPRAGDILGVVGIAFDEVLNLRALPGDGEDVLTALEPTADDLKATGRARLLDESIWNEVTVDGSTGWVNGSFVTYIGGTADMTSQVVAKLGDLPAAETVEDLGLVIAESQASADPPSTITMPVAPATGDLAEVTYDVLGLGDDSLFGFRLNIFGQRDEGRGLFVLKSVKSTDLCMRGVTFDGLCI